MENRQILSHIDYTVLKTTTDWSEIQKLCETAIAYNTASVCIPPSYVSRVKAAFGDKLCICTVIGFPLGYNTTAVKIFEISKTIEEGADEVDMVINLGDVKAGNFDAVTSEIAAAKAAAGSKILKVIVETCYLTEDEKVAVCKCVTDGGADYIKTSTGFGTGGAALEDIELFKKHIGANLKIKASGGVRSRDAMEAFITAGCDRIGASSIAPLLDENNG